MFFENYWRDTIHTTQYTSTHMSNLESVYKTINAILEKYTSTYIEPYLQPLESEKVAFIEKIKQSIIHHVQIYNLIFNYKINKPLVKKIASEFCYRFHNNIYKKYILYGKENANVRLYLQQEVQYCLSKEFAFYIYTYKIAR